MAIRSDVLAASFLAVWLLAAPTFLLDRAEARAVADLGLVEGDQYFRLGGIIASRELAANTGIFEVSDATLGYSTANQGWFSESSFAQFIIPSRGTSYSVTGPAPMLSEEEVNRQEAERKWREMFPNSVDAVARRNLERGQSQVPHISNTVRWEVTRPQVDPRRPSYMRICTHRLNEAGESTTVCNGNAP